MDFIKRRPFSFRVRAFLCLTLISLFYISLVRPVRAQFNQQIIAPYFLALAGENSTIITIEKRRINIQPDGYDSPRGFGIPFGGYFWLPMVVFIATRIKWPAVLLTGYHLFLAVVPPLLGLLFLKGTPWAGTVLQINETVFQAVFLIALFFGLKAGKVLWQEGDS